MSMCLLISVNSGFFWKRVEPGGVRKGVNRSCPFRSLGLWRQQKCWFLFRRKASLCCGWGAGRPPRTDGQQGWGPWFDSWSDRFPYFLVHIRLPKEISSHLLCTQHTVGLLWRAHMALAWQDWIGKIKDHIRQELFNKYYIVLYRL